MGETTSKTKAGNGKNREKVPEETRKARDGRRGKRGKEGERWERREEREFGVLGEGVGGFVMDPS